MGRQMNLKSCRDFCRRFGIAVRAGADLLKLLESEAKYGPARQRVAMNKLRDGAKTGHSLAETMKKADGFFPPLLIAMTRVGETSGRLERTMLMLAEHYEQQVQLKNGFIRAIAWPGLQLFAAIGVISLLIWLMGILKSGTGGPMNDILGFGLVGTSGVLWFWAYIGTFFACVAAAIFAYRKNFGGVQNIIPLFYKIPMVGGAVQTITLSRFTWTLSLALDSGIDPIASIEMALDSTASEYYRSSAKDAEKAIRGGATLASALQATRVLPDELITQVEIAELSGTDAESIGHIAKDYDQRAKGAMKTIAAIATGVIWLSVTMFLVFMILRILMSIVGAYSEALSPI